MISNPKIIITKHSYSEDPKWRKVNIRSRIGVKHWFYTIYWKRATSSNETLRNKSQIIRNAYQILKKEKRKKKKKDSIKHLLCFLLPEPPPPHTDARCHTSRWGAFKHARVCEYSVAILGFVSMICPFSQFGFRIIDEFGFFLGH